MVKRTIALQVLSGVGAAALSFALAGPVAAEEKLNIVYTHHSSASNPFWQAVKKGFDDACAKIQANCQMVFTQTEGSVDQEVANQQAALARKPDALITTLVDNNAFVANLKDAKAKGVIVIASNVDATEGPELELRQAFVGQNFIPAGTTLGRRMAALFPKEGPIRVNATYGFGVAATMVQVLKQCGNDLSRDNIMKEAANLKDLELPLLLPGIRVNTSPTNYSPIRQMQLATFNGESWELFGDLLSG